MKEFEKWLEDTKHTRLGYTVRDGCKQGWKAALEWVLSNRVPYYDIEDKKVVATDSDIINRELEI